MYQLTAHGKMTILAGASLHLIILIIIFPNTISFWRPIPFFVMVIGPISLLFIILSGPIFWIWNADLFEGSTLIPRRSTVLLLVSAALSIINGVMGIPYGTKYFGKLHTTTVLSISFSCLAILIVLRVMAYKRGSFTLNLIFNWLLFSWLLTYAFPYLGELP
jgi:hypothetical protein